MTCVEENIPSCLFVPGCERFLTEYISIALMMGGSVESSVLNSLKLYVWAISKADWLHTPYGRSLTKVRDEIGTEWEEGEEQKRKT